MTLADKIEALEAPSREVDFKIWLERNAPEASIYRTDGGKLYVRTTPPTSQGKILTHEGYQNAPPRYTSSIDAAMMLVPEGWHGEISFGLPPFQCTMHRGNDTFFLYAATPALALCAAALRAKGDGS